MLCSEELKNVKLFSFYWIDLFFEFRYSVGEINVYTSNPELSLKLVKKKNSVCLLEIEFDVNELVDVINFLTGVRDYWKSFLRKQKRLENPRVNKRGKRR